MWGFGVPWEFKAAPMRSDDPRGGFVGHFNPVLRRLGGDTVAFRVRLHAEREWSGFLAFYLPNGNQRRWLRLPLKAIDQTGQLGSKTRDAAAGEATGEPNGNGETGMEPKAIDPPSAEGE